MKISELAQRLADQERKTIQQLQPLFALKVLSRIQYKQ
jgi:hypothetical protein